MTILHTLSDDDWELINSYPQVVRRGLVYAPREIVFTAIVDQVLLDSQSGGIYQFTFTSPDGDAGDYEVGMTIDIGITPGGHEIGQFRLRGSDPTAFFEVNETAPGDVPLQTGQYVSVVKEFKFWQKRIRRVPKPPDNIDYDEYSDYRYAYGGENDTFYPPQCNITEDENYTPVRQIDFVTPGQTYRDVDLTMILSESQVNPITAYSWAIDGSYLVGGGSTATVKIRIPVGFQIIRCAVLTATGVQTRRLSMWTLTGWDDPSILTEKEFSVDSEDRAEGRSMGYTVWGTKAKSVPAGSLMGYFEVATFGGLEAPKQYIREFTGWATKESVPLSLFRSVWKLTVGGPQAWLNILNGYPQTVYDERYIIYPGNAAAKYAEMPNNTPGKMVHYILRIYTTAPELMNIFICDEQVPIEGYTSSEGKVWSQITAVMERCLSTAVCAADGSLWLRKHYSYLTDDERAARPPMATIRNGQWTNDDPLVWDELRTKACAQVDVFGSNFDIVITGGGSGLVDFSHVWHVQAPGIVQGDEGDPSTPPDLFLRTTQAALQDLLQIAGDYYARQNNKRPDIPLKFKGNLDVFDPAWGEPIRVIHDADNIRNLQIDTLLLIKSISIAHSNDRAKQAKVITYTFEEVTKGTIGHKIDEVLQREDVQEYPLESRYPEYTVDTVPTRLIVWDSASASCHTSILWSPTDSIIVYDDRSSGLGGVNHWSTGNPSNWDEYLALQSDGLYLNPAPFNGSSWTQVLTNLQLFGSGSRVGKFIAGSINRQGYFAILCGTHYVYTFDNWVTWHDAEITGGASNAGYQTALGTSNNFALSTYNNGDEGWVYAFVRGDVFTANRIYKSEDWGETWAVILDTALAGPVVFPYTREDGSTPNTNDSNQELYFPWHGANESFIQFSNTAGLSWSTRWHINAGGGYFIPRMGTETGWNIIPFTYDGAKLGFAGTNNGAETQLFAGTNPSAGDLTSGTITHNFGAFNPALGYINGSPIHSKAWMFFNRGWTSIGWTIDDLVTPHSAPLPAGYTGCSYGEWNFAPLVPPV